jgi:transcriptional regulator with XRE-family HTH domain
VTRSRSPTSREDDGSITPHERRRRAIGARLLELRRAAGLTQTAFAERLGITQSMVSKLEVGHSTPTGEVVERIVQVLDLPATVHEELLDQLAELSVEVEMLRVIHRRGGERSIQADVGKREATVTVLWNYSAQLVSGLLQTPDYTRSMIPLLAPTLPDVEDLVAGRVERQRVLYERSKSFRFLLHESALRARVAPTIVMRQQLDRILTIASAFPHVEVRVLSHSAVLTAWAITSFSIADDTVGVELQAGTVRVRDPREVAAYRDLFERLWASAVTGEALIALVRDVDAWLATLED